mmetsp:Transcript_3070/g.3428  ORF Transcript_3070/g.3428 Transcript_3070/m.3428 type:complete len:1836 (-) Transcript_3070:992-6499(-)
MSESELALINKVELRIALAEDDKKFEETLKLYLAPLLLKLGSPYTEVRQAILKIIQYLIPRISAARTIKLPVNALLDQVKNPKVPAGEGPPLVRLYSLLLISRSIERLSPEEKKELVPKVIENISTYPISVSSRLFNIFCKLLDCWKVPERDSKEYNEMNIFLQFDKNPQDEEFLSKVIGKFLLLQPNSTSNPLQFSGLSTADTAFFTQDAGVSYKSSQEIYVVKLRLLEFLKSGFHSKNIAFPLLVASCDSSSSISDPSEILFRKLDIDLEDPSFINALVELFVGSSKTFTPPVGPILQEKILSILLKSRYAARHSDISKLSSVALASDYSKLKRAAVHFIKWVSKNHSENENLESVKEFNIDMASQLRSNLMGEGWPRIDMAGVRNYSSAINQRLLQYEALGNILKSNPELILDDFTYFEFLFQSLEGEESELRSAIQDALSGLTIHLPNISTFSKNKLKSLAKKYLSEDKIELKENLHSCRYIAIKYVNCAFPFNDSEARVLCIFGTSKDNRPDTIEEAQKGLHPYWFNILQSSNTLEFKATSDLLGSNSKVEFPSFSDIVFTLKAELNSAEDQENSKLLGCMACGIQFILHALVMQSISGKTTVIVPDEEWLVRIDKAIDVDQTVINCLIKEIRFVSQEDSTMDENSKTYESSFRAFLSIIFDCFVGQYRNNNKILSNITYGTTFTKLLSLSPPSVIEKLTPFIPDLLLISNDRSLNESSSVQIAKSIGVIASHPINDNLTINNLLNKIIAEELQNPTSKTKLLIAAYVLSRLALHKRIDFIDSELLVTFCNKLLYTLQNLNTYYTGLECISQLAIFGLLGPVLEVDVRLKTFWSKFIEEIKPRVKRCDERSVLTLSHLLMASNDAADTENLNEYEKLVYDTHVSKQIEYVFTSGEAFTILAAGWDSKVLERQIDIQDESVEYIPSNTSRLAFILKVTLESCNNTKPSLRKAGCIWLLSLVQYCGHLSDIKDRATEIHLTFMRFLADRDELVQESASRGLSIVYEMGDYDLKDTLVRGLLKSFTDSNSSTLAAGSVGHETELFEPDLLKTNDGSVSTYKDVLNLASDVGDPSLVYKFMSLAKSSALWSSRKGMAFGLGSILSKSSLDELISSNKGLANKLIPKLYRYRYDPNSSVSKSMNDIWNALIKDSSKTVNDNFDLILNELLKEMGNKEWRVRQASTAALNDLLQTVSLDVYEERLEQIWGMSFRAMDDIKESVRKEGSGLTRSLATTLTRTADVKSGVSINKAKKVLSNLIPFLLGSKGLLSDAEDIKKFALDTVLKLCKVGGSAMKPFIPDLLDNFINLMSSLEPEAVNYVVLNADKYNMKSNDIDAQRLQSLGHSPMMDAIEKLLDSLDNSLMPGTVQILQQSIKRSIGLPSKVCGSRVLVSLVVKHLELVKPYGDQLLKTCINQLNDKNDTIASSYASAAGYLCRIASIDKIIEYSKVLLKLYFESDDDRSREIAGIGSESMSKYSGDKFELVLSAFLPLAFIGKHDSVKTVKQPFEREWIESTSGNNSIKLYMKEICDICETYLTSNQYRIRKTIGKAIVALCNSIEATTAFPLPLMNKLFTILIEACKGKSWSGKELILESLVSISVKSKMLINNDNVLFNKLNKVIITEAKRRNKEYQKHSVKLMGRYLKEFPSDELIETYVGLMTELLSDDYYEDSEDEIEDVKPGKTMVKMEEDRLLFVQNLFDTISIPINDSLCNLMLRSSIGVFRSKIDVTWRSKVQINQCLMSFVKELIHNDVIIDTEEMELLYRNWTLLENECMQSNNIENVKIQFIRYSKVLIMYFEKINEVKKAQNINSSLEEFCNTETSAIIRSELLKVRD